MFQFQTKETFVTTLKEKIQYFEDNSTLKRFGHVVSIAKHSVYKRIFWLVFLSACCAGAGAVLRGSLGLYTQDAVSYAVETDYLEWDTPFPAITICQDLSTVGLMKDTLSRKGFAAAYYNFAKEVMVWTKSCKFCVNCKVDKNCLNDVAPFVEALRADCEEMLTDCWWNGEYFPCCERFLPVYTQYGRCFVFNSRNIGTEDIEIVNRRMALPVLTFSSVEFITVKVHSPDEIATVAIENSLGTCEALPLVTDFEVTLSAEQTVNDVAVKNIAQGSRDCLFLDETPVSKDPWPFPRYSYSACVWYCNAKAQAELCNCTHHFMPRFGHLPVCDVQGLVCLLKNQGSLAYVECDCPMECEETKYKVVHVTCSRLDDDEEAASVTRGRIRLAHLPTLRVRRYAIRDMLGLVVDFGGVIGVFFGASLLSFIEIVYIFCLRKHR